MRIESSVGTCFFTPTPEQIAEIIYSLPGGTDSFATLEKDKDYFIQAAGSASEGFIVEYYDKSETGEFQASGEPQNISSVIDMFQRYSVNDESWKGLSAWEPLHTGSTSKSTKIAAGILLATFFLFIVFVMTMS